MNVASAESKRGARCAPVATSARLRGAGLAGGALGACLLGRVIAAALVDAERNRIVDLIGEIELKRLAHHVARQDTLAIRVILDRLTSRLRNAEIDFRCVIFRHNKPLDLCATKLYTTSMLCLT